jgi:hypothetical protein
MSLDDLPQEEVIAVVDEAITGLIRSAGVAAPPVDAIALAQRHLGMVVCLDRNQPQRGRAQRAAGNRQIYLRPEPIEERHQWTVAHEIGEHLKAGLLERLGLAPAETPALAGETLANLFAHRLLVPTAWFSADAPAAQFDLLALKKRYATASHQVIAWRFLDLKQPCGVTIVDNGKVSRRRSNAWGTFPPELLKVEANCQAEVARSGHPMTLATAGWTVQGWPIHREDWRREILRSMLDSE